MAGSLGLCSECGQKLSADERTFGVKVCGDCEQKILAEERTRQPRTPRLRYRWPTRAVRRQTRATNFPDDIADQRRHLQEPFSANPFRVLRLQATATPDEVASRAAAARVEAGLGDESKEALEELRRAEGELQDPWKRVLHDAGWFYQPPNSLYDGIIPGDDGVLQRYKDGSLEVGDGGTRSRHDAANWLLLRACHEPLPEEAKALSLRAFAAWAELLSAGVYTSMLSSSAMSERPYQNMIWHAVVLGAVADAVRRKARRENVDGVIAYIEAIKLHGAEDTEIESLATPALEALGDKARQAVKDVESERQSSSITAGQATIWTDKVEEALRLLKELCAHLGEGLVAQYLSILNEGAMLIRALALDLHNDLKETDQAADLMQRAEQLAGTTDTRHKLQGEARNLNFQALYLRGVYLYQNGRYSEAKAIGDEAYSSAATDEERNLSLRLSEQAASAEVAAQSGTKKRFSFWWVVAGLVVAIIIVQVVRATMDSGDSSAPSYSPPSNSPSRFSSPTGASSTQLLQQINANKSRMSSLRSQVETMDSQLGRYQSRMDEIKRRYPSLVLPDQEYSEYNDLIRRYNSTVDSRQLLADEHNSLLRETNRLVDQYNRGQ